MELTARLVDVRVPEAPKGIALVLHGGAARRAEMVVSPTQLSVLRMIPIAQAIARAGKGELAVHRLLNSSRGWDERRTPVQDVGWALDQLPPGVPVCLVGHSLGGRAALLALGRSEVRSAVALAPWVYPSDRPPGNQPVLVVHGSDDRIARPERAEAVVRAMGPRAAFVEVAGAKHAMLRRGGEFAELAAAWATQTLLGRSDSPVVDRVLAGERRIVI